MSVPPHPVRSLMRVIFSPLSRRDRPVLCDSARAADRMLALLHSECGLREVTTEVRGSGGEGRARSGGGRGKHQPPADQSEPVWIRYMRPTFGYLVDGRYALPHTHTHTHAHIHLYILRLFCCRWRAWAARVAAGGWACDVCVCMCVCVLSLEAKPCARARTNYQPILQPLQVPTYIAAAPTTNLPMAQWKNRPVTAALFSRAEESD